MSKVFIRSISNRAVLHLLAVLSVSLIATLFVAVQLVAAQSNANEPTVRSFNGPTELKVGEEGVWRVTTTTQEESPLTYRIRWGDEKIMTQISDAAFSLFRKSDDFVQKTTFTHFYKKSGDYKITITVRDQNGNTSKTTSTVRVNEAEFKEAKFSVEPDSGKSPLEVVFKVDLGTRPQARIDFGDNSDQALVECDQTRTNERAVCDSPIEVVHTYQEAGSYKATLFKIFEQDKHVKDTIKIRVKTGNPVLDFFHTITDAFQGTFDASVSFLFPDDENVITDREFANLPDINTDEYRSGTRSVDEIEAIIINDQSGDRVTCNLSNGDHTFQAYIITSTNEIGISDCANADDVDGYLTTIITNLTLRHAFSGLTLENMKLVPIYIGDTGEDLTETKFDEDITVPEEDVNKIGFEVKVKDSSGATVQNWVQGNITIKSTDSLSFRWDARTGYAQCLPFLADNGSYALTRTNTQMLTGNTENENFNIYERAGAYYVECERTKDSTNVHTSVIEVTIDDDSDREVAPSTKDQYSTIKSDTEPLTVTVKRNAPAGCSNDIKYIGEIDWGDGSITRQPDNTTQECRDAQALTESHTYAKAGTYRIVVKLNGISVLRKDVTVRDEDQSSGNTLKVTVDDSDSLLVKLTTNDSAVNKKIAECKFAIGFFGPSGNGLNVDWGDGVEEPGDSYSDIQRGQSCTNFVSSHTYETAGTYTVTLKSWHPGPTDAPITDWEKSTTVTVGGDDDDDADSSEFSANPQSGKAELKVTFELPANKNTTLSFGDKSKSRSFAPCVEDDSSDGDCPDTRTVTHTYAKTGTYTARLISGCPIQAGACDESAKVETVTITVK